MASFWGFRIQRRGKVEDEEIGIVMSMSVIMVKLDERGCEAALVALRYLILNDRMGTPLATRLTLLMAPMCRHMQAEGPP